MKKGFIISIAVAVLCISCIYMFFIHFNGGKNQENNIFRTNQAKIQILQEGKWTDFNIKGVNMGTGYPGVFPNEFGIDQETYSRWFEWIGEMNANTIRVYKIQSPEFYAAFSQYNETHENKIYLIQGVDFSEDLIFSEENLLNQQQKSKVFQDTKKAVDVLHGKTITLSPQNGDLCYYHYDVSDYVLGYILGVEWDEIFVDYVCRLNEGLEPYHGTYVSSRQDANAFEIFFSQWGDYLFKYEEETYGTQKLLSFANWPETDPLINEVSPKLSVQSVTENTEAFIDLENLQLSDQVKSGMFASYNVYPYFPTCLQYGKYTEYIDDEGNRNPYRKYLMELVAHHSCPVIISEYGIPASRSPAYKDVWRNLSQGGNTETEQGIALLKMYEDIQKAGCAGSMVFTWQDEWFKRSWNEKSLSNPDGRASWSNAQSIEQFYGLLAFEPGDGKVENYPDGNISEWSEKDLVLESNETKLSMKSDEKYIYFMAQGLDHLTNHSSIHLALDILPNVGTTHTENLDFALPVDFLIQINTEKGSKLLVHDDSDLAVYSIAIKNKSATVSEIYKKAEELMLSMSNNTDTFDVVSRACGSVNNFLLNEKPLEEVGVLKQGNANPNSENYDSNADYCINGDIVEIRIPWPLLNFYDPSKCLVIDDFRANNYQIKGLKIDRIYAAAYYDNQTEVTQFGAYELKSWETPQFHERLKQSYYILQEAFGREKAS